ncbi:HAD family hydrolase [Specibacter cremeus]|uniref:HAD family hydrolase n=1 Tax=Specibacter cremeus TaxID=1629051 RepID=UPI000F7A85A0|nr:HAD family hydrolase [Specibacter cremeus]
MPAVAGRDAPGPVVAGVLFDIDDTLIDLRQAMRDTIAAVSADLLDLSPAGWDAFTGLYLDDAERYYDRYVAGEFGFAEQRGLRARAALAAFGVTNFSPAREASWVAAYEEAQPGFIRPFADVLPVLDRLDSAGIPYGAVSNNVHDYQRAKLDRAGLSRVTALVGIDTVGVAKPAPAVFHEGCRLLGTLPEETLYVGDNLTLDAVGATDAGLWGVWLDRSGSAAAESWAGPRLAGLDELAGLLG